MKFAKVMILFTYWNLFLLILCGESPLLVMMIGALFTLLILFIRSGLYHRWIMNRKNT